MAEESINIRETPKVVIPDGVGSRCSEGKFIASKGGTTKQPDPRRASTGSFSNEGRKFSSRKPGSLNSRESPVPHYLRASTGSCHDFCKYGRKHETEVRPWQARARKVKDPALNPQNDSETGDLSEKNTKKLCKSKSPSVSRTNFPNPSADFGNKVSSPSNMLAIPSRPVSAKEKEISVNEKKKKNVSEKRKTSVVNGRRENGSGLTIPTRPVSTEEDIAVNEKKKNVIAKQNTTFLTGRRESEIKPDTTKGTSKEVMRKLVSSPVAYLAIKPFNGVLSPKGDANRNKKSLSNLKDQNEITKAEHKHPINDAVKKKTLHVIKVEAKKTIPEVETNQEGIKEAENELVENEKVTKQNDTFDVPPFRLSSSQSIPSLFKSPVLSYGEEGAGDELEFNTCEKKVAESKQNGNTIDVPPYELFSSLNISSPGKTPALSFGEEEARVEPQYTAIEKKIPELERNESTRGSPTSESSSSRSISLNSPILSCSEEEAEDGLELNTSEKKVPESKQNESTNEIPPSELFSSPISSPALSYGEEEAQDGPEYTNIEKKDPELVKNESACDSLPSESFSSLSYDKEEAQDEIECLDTETNGSDDSICESCQSDDEEISIGKHSNETRKGHGVSEGNVTATKLKFKRGKVVEIESNNSGSRRLRFRCGRSLGENQDKDVKNRRSFIKGGVLDDINGTNDDSEKVVLRHQEVEAKKDAQGLFNNVIKETASKLVETRKSKVKALVGAFETVISLQENKPATQTASDEK